MKVLAENEKLLRLGGLLPPVQSTMVNKIRRVATICVFAALLLSVIFGSVSYVYFYPENVSDWILELIEFSYGLTAFVAYTEILANATTVQRIFDELQSVMNKAQGTNAIGVYRETELQYRFYTKWLTIGFVGLNFAFNFGIFTVALPVFEMWRGNFDTSTWFFPFKYYVPFDISTVWGWYTHATIISLIGVALLFVYTVVLSYLATCCMYIRTCCQHIQIIFDDNDGEIQAKDIGELQQMKELLENIKTVHSLHMKIMEIQQLVSFICSRTILTLLLSNVLIFSGLTYFVEEEAHNRGYASCMIYIISLIQCLNWTFLLSYATTTATVAIGNVAVTVYNSKWNDYPPEMQKYLIFLMARSQIPVYFTGMGLVRCTVEVFMKLNNKALSYYMIFRSLSGR